MIPFPFQSGGLGLVESVSGSGAATQALTFDPTRKGSNVTLSGGNLIAETTNTSIHNYVMCTLPKSSGIWLFEITVDRLQTGTNASSTSFGVGAQDIGPSSGTPTTTSGGDYWGTASKSLCRHYDATAFTTLTGTLAPFTGDIITIGTNLGTKEMKVWKNGTLISTKTITSIDTGAHVYVPFMHLRAADAGVSNKVSINPVIQYPQVGYTPWA